MAACEKCWRDATERAALRGGSVIHHYDALIKERNAKPCTPEEQRGEPAKSAPSHAQGAE